MFLDALTSPHPRQHAPLHLLRIAPVLRILAEQRRFALNARNRRPQPDKRRDAVPPRRMRSEKPASDEEIGSVDRVAHDPVAPAGVQPALKRPSIRTRLPGRSSASLAGITSSCGSISTSIGTTRVTARAAAPRGPASSSRQRRLTLA